MSSKTRSKYYNQYKRYCCVYGCMNKTNSEPDLTFFQIPPDIERRREWLKVINREDLLDENNLKKPKHYHVCSVHFDDSAIITIAMKRLKCDAVPTKLLPHESHRNIQPDTRDLIITPKKSSTQALPQTSQDISSHLQKPTKKDKLLVSTYSHTETQTDTQQQKEIESEIAQLNAEDIIASVYNYLQAEYKQLKSSIGGHCDLKRLADKEPLNAGHAKRAKLSHDYGDGNVSPITDDEASCGAPDKEQNKDKEQDKNKQTQGDSQESDDFGVETLKVTIKEEEEDKPTDPLQLQMSELETDSAVQHLLSNISTNTINTQSVDVSQHPGFVIYPQSDSGVLRVMSIEPMMSLATVKTEPDDDPPNSDTPSSDVQFEPPS